MKARRKITHCIREWRTHRNLTAEQLADMAGLTGSFISQLENGRSAYTQTSLEKIAYALEIEPWQLLDKPEHAGRDDLDKEFWKAIPAEHHERVKVLFNSTMQYARTFAENTAREMFRPPHRRREGTLKFRR